jgi:dihydroflavonol-4-reductase
MIVVLTGASGVLGAAAARALIAGGARVRLVVRDLSEVSFRGHPRIEPYRGDPAAPATWRKALLGADVFLHADPVFGPTRDADSARRRDVEETRSALAAAREAGICRAVVANSALIFGPTHGYGVATERTRPLRADFVLSEQFRMLDVRDVAKSARADTFDVAIAYIAPLRPEDSQTSYAAALKAAYAAPATRALLPLPSGSWTLADVASAGSVLADLALSPREPNAERIVAGKSEPIAASLPTDAALPSLPSFVDRLRARSFRALDSLKRAASGDSLDPTLSELAAFAVRDWVFADSRSLVAS